MLETVVDLPRQGVALALLLTDAEEPHPRSLHPVDALHVDGAHVGELHQVGRLAVGVGAHVQRQDSVLARREVGAEGRPLDAAQASQHQEGRGDHGSGVPGRNDSARLTLLYQAEGFIDGGVTLLAHGLGRQLAHVHHLAGRHHPH